MATGKPGRVMLVYPDGPSAIIRRVFRPARFRQFTKARVLGMRWMLARWPNATRVPRKLHANVSICWRKLWVVSSITSISYRTCRLPGKKLSFLVQDTGPMPVTPLTRHIYTSFWGIIGMVIQKDIQSLMTFVASVPRLEKRRATKSCMKKLWSDWISSNHSDIQFHTFGSTNSPKW